MAEAQHFNNADFLSRPQLDNRLKLCFELFLTKNMETWARTLDVLKDTLSLTVPQMKQFRTHIYRNQPALYQRINFMHIIQNKPAPDHQVANPADRHFSHEGQLLLRQQYAANPAAGQPQILAFVAQSAMKKCSNHATQDLQKIQRMVLIWWDCQIEATIAPWVKFRPSYHYEELHLMLCLLNYCKQRQDLAIDVRNLAANMWRYSQTLMQEYLDICNLTFEEPEAVYQMVRTQLSDNFGITIFARQERLRKVTSTVFAESVQVWSTGATSAEMEEIIAQNITIAVVHLHYIHEELYIQALLQRNMIHHLVERFLRLIDLTDEEARLKHEKMKEKYDMLESVLVKRHETFLEQHQVIKDHGDWFMANVNSRENRSFKLPTPEPWIAAHPVTIHPHSHDA